MEKNAKQIVDSLTMVERTIQRSMEKHVRIYLTTLGL
jgi:hypothetical protein